MNQSTHRVALALVCVLATVMLVSCDREQSRARDRAAAVASDAAPGKSSISIVTIEPDTTGTLHVGEQIKLRVVATHTLDADSGTITLVVQAADNSRIAQNFEVISRGNAKTTLEAEFTVPNTKAIQVFVPLMAQGQGPTSTVDSRAYRVTSN
jgi:hypothetical protein